MCHSGGADTLTHNHDTLPYKPVKECILNNSFQLTHKLVTGVDTLTDTEHSIQLAHRDRPPMSDTDNQSTLNFHTLCNPSYNSADISPYTHAVHHQKPLVTPRIVSTNRNTCAGAAAVLLFTILFSMKAFVLLASLLAACIPGAQAASVSQHALTGARPARTVQATVSAIHRESASYGVPVVPGKVNDVFIPFAAPSNTPVELEVDLDTLLQRHGIYRCVFQLFRTFITLTNRLGRFMSSASHNLTLHTFALPQIPPLVAINSAVAG